MTSIEEGSKLPEHLSASSIQTYIQCPEKFKLSRVDGIKEPPTTHTTFGNFVHDVMELFYTTIPPEERNTASLRSCCTATWVNGGWEDIVTPLLRMRAPQLTWKSINDFRWGAWWCVENIFVLEDPVAVTPSGVEFEVFGKIDGVLIKGYIDRWTEANNMVTISDYKTGKVPADKYAGDKFFQLCLYALLMRELHGKENFELELLYIKHGVRKKYSPSELDLEKAKNTIVNTKKEILVSHEQHNWPAIPSGLCNFCYFKSHLCSYWNPANER